MQIAARLKNAAAIQHKSLGEKAFIQVSERVEELRHRHPKEIDCPDCGARLDAKAAISPGGEGLVGMACPKRHGATGRDESHSAKPHPNGLEKVKRPKIVQEQAEQERPHIKEWGKHDDAGCVRRTFRF